MKDILAKIRQKQEEIYRWLDQYEDTKELPLYTSVDIRDGGFKMAVVDTNLFPSGFNNLCPHGIEDAGKAIKEAILNRVARCRNVLIIAEEHTRNLHYLEHLWVLQKIIQDAGFNVKVATFLKIGPALWQDANYIELATSEGNLLKIYSIRRVVQDIEAGGMYPCLIILNNDLISGVPDILEGAETPIYPSIRAGWHSRMKSHHFSHTANLIEEFSKITGYDPWFFTCLNRSAANVNINEDKDRLKLADLASDLFKDIFKKYKEHNINEKPFIFIKADRGTYGMGVMAVEDPGDIATLSSRKKNKLYRGKGSQVIDRYLLQEGVPTIARVEGNISEACIYQISNTFIGGFYRVNEEKTDRQNLNSSGMRFEKMCPHNNEYGDCGVHTEHNIFDVYRILARIAGIAAHREIMSLEEAVQR